MRLIDSTRIFCVILMLLLVVGFSTVSMAELKTLRIEISDVISGSDAIKLKRLLSPWVDAKDITFSTPVDKNGKKRLFTTVVELKPRSGDSKWTESHVFDVYDIMRQLKDSRYRGRHGISQVRLLKTEATVRGTLFAHPAHGRSNIRDVPAWARWRPHTSEIHHAFRATKDGQNFVFMHSPEFDQLRTDMANSDREIDLKGKVVGFDGPYPIMRVQSYKLLPRVNRNKTPERSIPKEGEKPAEKGEGEKPAEKGQPKYDYFEYDR